MELTPTHSINIFLTRGSLGLRLTSFTEADSLGLRFINVFMNQSDRNSDSLNFPSNELTRTRDPRNFSQAKLNRTLTHRCFHQPESSEIRLTRFFPETDSLEFILMTISVNLAHSN